MHCCLCKCVGLAFGPSHLDMVAPVMLMRPHWLTSKVRFCVQCYASVVLRCVVVALLVLCQFLHDSVQLLALGLLYLQVCAGGRVCV